MSFSLIYICCSFRGAFYLLFFYCSHISDPQGTWSALVSFFRSYPLPFPCPFVSKMFLSLPFLLCLYSLIYTCCSFRKHSICCFPCCSHMFLTRREPGMPLSCPCLFSDLILFPFLVLFFYIVPYPSFSSMSFSLIYICCSFRGGILVYPLFSAL